MAYDGTLKFDTSVNTKGFQDDAGKLGNIVKGLGVFKIIEKGFAAITASIDKAVSRYDTLNRFPKIMKQMGFSAEETDVSMRKLSDGIQGLPTALDQIVGSTQRVASMTGSLSGAADITLALNNAFLASGASSDAASRGMEQYMQIIGRGKPEMEDWKTLQETMPYALQKVAESFGFAGTSATRDFYAALQSGEITVEQMNARFVELSTTTGGFAETAKTATGGIGTAFTNMQTSIVRGVAGVITAIDSGLSQTRFKSIENIVSGMGKGIESVLKGVAGAFGVVAKNIDALLPILIAVSTAFKAYTVVGTATTALKGFQAVVTTATATLAASQGMILMDAASHTMLTAALASGTKAEAVRTAAKKAGMTIDAAGNLVTAQGTAATVAQTATVLASSGALTAKTVIVGLLTGTLSLATAAQWALNAAFYANPIGLIIAAVVLLVGVLVGLIALLSRGSEEYRKQKAEVEALTEAQGELAESAQTSEDAFASNTDSMAANAKVAKNLVGNLKEISNSSASAEDKHRRMDSTVKQLNATVDGLNIAYDRESGAITNLNTGQEISIAQLEELVGAKAELAQANAWAERANELVKEQVKLLEEQEVILNKIDEINANEALSQKEKDKLIKELTTTFDEYGTMVEGVQGRIDIANQNVESSDTTMAEAIVANHTLAEQAITSSGESIEDVAAQWGVSVDDILAAMERENISLDEWVTRQQDAWTAYEESVKERTQGVINSFKEIPGEYETSAAEMLQVLQNNKERYAEWEVAMAEITRQLGPTAAEEFAKLGPEATSAMQEILGSADLLDEYREVFGVKLDEVTGLAVEDWNDPNFVGAPSGAIDSSAQMVTQNTALDTAMADTMQGGVTAAEEVDFSTVGQNIATDIAGAITGQTGAVTAAVTGMSTSVQGVFNTMSQQTASTASQMMSNVANSIISGAARVTASSTSMSTSVQNVFKTMSTQTQSTVVQMMTSINSTIVSRTGAIRASITSMGNSITTALNTAKTQAVNITTQMMTGINSAIVSRTGTVKASMTSCANGVVTALTEMKTKSATTAEQTMTGINSAIVSRTGTVKASAAAVSSGTVDSLQPMVKGAAGVAESMMDGIGAAMDRKAEGLYKKAREIARRIAATMQDALDVHSPSRVMIWIFENVMRGIYVAMDGMSGMLFREADSIANGLAERLTISPDVVKAMTSQLRTITELNPLGGSTLVPQLAYAGAGGGTRYVTSLTQHITTPKPLSASEMTREGQDLLRRSRWQLP